MSRGNPRDPHKERFWRQMIQQWRQSGLSIRAFCQRHHLSEPNFYAWRRTLAQRDTQTLTFVPVELLPELPSPPTTATTRCGLELLLPNGRLLRIGPDFDEPTLRRLLAVLQEELP